MTYNQVYHGQRVLYRNQTAIVQHIGTYQPTFRSLFAWIARKYFGLSWNSQTKATIIFSDGTESSVLLTELKPQLSSGNENKPKGG